MADEEIVETLIAQLLEWLAAGDQPYEAVMSAWRTSCPRLPVWEEANDRGLLRTEEADGYPVVRITPAGQAFLTQKLLARAR